jgi:hypothetical protein
LRAYRANGAHKDYTEVFLSHSQLYVFADYYRISRLMKLSIHRLQQTLIAFSLHNERIKDIVKLLQYCYANLVPAKLRELVVLYAACHMEKLWKNKEFRELLEA